MRAIDIEDEEDDEDDYEETEGAHPCNCLNNGENSIKLNV